MMKLQPLSLAVVLTALTPSLVFSQSQQITNCHTPESAGNFIGSDETIVNGMVCKTTKPQPNQQQIVVQQSAAAATNGQPQSNSSDGSEITDARVIEMSKLGLDDDIIIARIKHGTCRFQLGDTDLLNLKKAGVSSKVIAAMLDAVPATPAASMPVTTSASVTPESPVAPSDGKVRVFVTDSQSWETRGGSSAGGNKNGWGGSSWMAGGARPQTAEIIKTLNERCPQFTVTNNLAKADFVVTLDHEGGKGYLRHRNKVAVFNRDGDDIFSDSTRELGNAVKDACQAMLKSHK
jgi:hypothetical protein